MLWNARALERMRALHADGYKLVIFGNRTGIQGAFTGKNADKSRVLVDWLAHVAGVPIHCLFATRKPPHDGARFLKPQIGLCALKQPAPLAVR